MNNLLCNCWMKATSSEIFGLPFDLNVNESNKIKKCHGRHKGKKDTEQY